tara:strand:- start:563 stop:736 length:174 start_codon:yes stop_codon:yes gene_type:complete
MNITSAKYLSDLNNSNSTIKATIDGQEMFVPINAEGNRHWVAIQEWVAEGNTIAEAD